MPCAHLLQDRGGVQDRLSFYFPILKDCCKFTVIRVFCTFYHIHSYSPTLTWHLPPPTFHQLISTHRKLGFLLGLLPFTLFSFLHKACILFGLSCLIQHGTKVMIYSRLHKPSLYLIEPQLFKELRLCINTRTENKISFSCSCYRPAIRGLGCLGVKFVGEGVRVNPGLNPICSSPSPHVRYLWRQKPEVLHCKKG
jgi:hypothetical protein